MAKLTKADIPDLESMARTDERIANNKDLDLDTRTMARHRADQARATVAELKNS